ncbi:MAG TPA: M23 family metallopeptidase [Longimicrobiaceae bacterium]
MRNRILPLAAAVLLAACADTPPTGSAGADPGSTRVVRDDVVGVSLAVPEEWRVERDPVLFNTHGFALFDPRGPRANGHERSPVARISLAYRAEPGQVEALVRDLTAKYAEFPLTRTEVAVGDGLRGTAVSGLPGTDPYTLVYVADGGRVYRIGLWTEEPGLDARALALLAGLRFEEPRRSIASLGLVPVERAARAAPSPEQAALSARAHAERVALVAAEGGEPAAEPEPARPASAAAACEFGQPGGFFWQTVWDATNRFYSGYTTSYSGTYYNERPGDPGWSAMSGNYGSWWGQGYHVRKCDPYLLNQYYANDWPAHRNANVYSAIKGTVEWAGWDYYDSEGYYTLGNYVVVRNGAYRALMAHLNSIAVSPGATVGMNTIIGYAGRTGGPWDEHVHSRVAYGESLTYNGQPYGGNTVWPTKLRCVSCRASDPGDAQGEGDGQFDFKDSTGAKFYTRFYHGRWMRG